MNGLNQGIDLRQKFDDSRRKRKNQEAIDKINSDTNTAFNQAVKSGQADSNGFEQFWMKFALPKMTKQMLLTGNVQGALALQKWGESEDAMKGGKLFASAMVKAQTGDAAGALKDALDAAHIKGYIDHGYSLLGQENITDKDGNVVGFRLSLKDPDGKKLQQDIAVADVPKLVATFANPEAAWQSQQTARAAEKKRQEGLEDYATKKKIDQAYATPKTPDFNKRYAAARAERMKNDLDFADKTPEEQDKVVRGDLAAAEAYANGKTGEAPSPSGAAASAAAPAPAGSAKKIIVDQGTGQQVPIGLTPAAAASRPAPTPNAAPGMAQSPMALPSSAPVPTQAPNRTPADPAAAAGTAVGAMAGPAPGQASKEQAIADAVKGLSQGADPKVVAAGLERAGVTQDEWQAAVAQMRQRPAAQPLGIQ